MERFKVIRYDKLTYTDYYYMYLLFGPKREYHDYVFYQIDIHNLSISFYSSSGVKRPINFMFLGNHPLIELYTVWTQYLFDKLVTHDGKHLVYPSMDDIDEHFQYFTVQNKGKDDWCSKFEHQIKRTMQEDIDFYSRMYRVNFDTYDKMRSPHELQDYKYQRDNIKRAFETRFYEISTG